MRLRIRFGTREVEYEGSKGFLKTCIPDLLKIVKGSGLDPDKLEARDDALSLIGGLQSDMQLLETHYQMISDLDEQLSTAVRNFGTEVEGFFRAIISNPGLTGGSSAQGSGSPQAGVAAGGDSSAQLLNATKQMQETQMSFNLQYLQLQSQMQHENRSYTAISNIMKTKHETVKNSISNIR